MKPLFIIALFVSVSFVEGGFRPVTPNAPTHPLANAHHPSFADVTHHYYTPEQLEFHKQQLQKQQEEMIKYQKEHEQIAFVDGFQCDYVYLEATRYPGLVLVEFAQEPITESERTEKGSDNQKPQNQKRIVVGHGLVPLVDESGSITHALHLEKSNPTSAPTEKSQTKFKVHKPSQRPPKKIHFYAENNIVIVATKEGVLKSAKVDDKIEFPVYDATFELVAHDAILNKGKSNQDEYKNQASHDYRFMIRSVQNPQLYLTVDPESHKILLAENAVHLWSAKAGKRPESMVIESVGHGFLSVKAEEGSIVELQEKIEDSDGFYMVPSLLFQYYYGNLPLMSMNPENLMTSKVLILKFLLNKQLIFRFLYKDTRRDTSPCKFQIQIQI